MFETTVFSTWDLPDIKNTTLRKWIINPYVRWAKGIVRTETDVIMITHLLTYLCTSIPSALYQRDSVLHFLHYVGRFYLLVWFDLPRYFLRNNKTSLALKAGGCEIANYVFLYSMYKFVNPKAAIFVFLIPLALMRIALMTGNWGQHAFVDEVEPDSDFRSSITLIDAPVSITHIKSLLTLQRY